MNANTQAEPTIKVELTADVEAFVSQCIQAKLAVAIFEEISRQEARRFGQLKWIGAVVGIVGLGTFGTLANYAIEKAVEAKSTGVVQAVDFIHYSQTADAMNRDDSFDTSDAQAVMRFLRRSSQDEVIKGFNGFSDALSSVIRALTSAGMSSEVDEIFSLYEHEVLLSDVTIEALLHHYGQDIAGRLKAPSDDLSLTTFEKLERLAEGVKIPELGLYYRIMYEHGRTADIVSPAVIRLLHATTSLNDFDRRRFWYEVLTHSKAENWQEDPTPRGRRIEELTHGLLKLYASELSKGYKLGSGEFDSLASGVSTDDGSLWELAEGISSAARSREITHAEVEPSDVE